MSSGKVGVSLSFMLSTLCVEAMILNAMRQGFTIEDPAVRHRLFGPQINRCFALTTVLVAQTDGERRAVFSELTLAFSEFINAQDEAAWARIQRSLHAALALFPDVPLL